MDKKVEQDFFKIEKVTGTMIAGFILWASSNILLYFLGTLLSGSILMPKYFFFLLLINIIGGAIGALILFNVEKE